MRRAILRAVPALAGRGRDDGIVIPDKARRKSAVSLIRDHKRNEAPSEGGPRAE
jgi:hypothetical protein